MSEKIYSELAEMLGAPVSTRFLAILEEMLSPEEAEICLELHIPGTCAEVATALGKDEGAVRAACDSLIDRGILTRGETQFAFHTTLLGFHHDVADTGVFTGPHAMSQKIKDLWADFFYNEWSVNWVKLASDRKAAGGRGIMLTPAIRALELSPNITPDMLLPQEDWRSQIKFAKRRIVAPCGCRSMWGKCDHPTFTCFACFDNSRGEYFLDQPGRLLKELTEQETLDLVRANEEAGLIHWGVCYCCSDACEMLYSYTQHHRLDLVEPNRFQAAVDVDTCTGCQTCVEKCPFEAIDMVKVPGSKKLKASIVPENCKGCGVCVVGCPQQAMHLEVVRPKEYMQPRKFQYPIPEKTRSGRRIPVNVKFGPYGGYYNLD